MSDEDLRAELDRLKAENEALKKGAAKGVSLKVSEKGGVSVYGLGRFPSRSTKSNGSSYSIWSTRSALSLPRTSRN